jgi:pantoate kinase
LQSLVFAPSHITGFFEIIDHPNPLIRGSRGAGVVLDQGVITRLNVSEGMVKPLSKPVGNSVAKNIPWKIQLPIKHWIYSDKNSQKK